MIRATRIAAGVTVVLIVVGSLAACSTGTQSAVTEEPIEVEDTDQADISRLTLTALAAERLDIQTATVEPAADGLVVPSAAVIIDPDGTYWVYTSPDPLVFMRQEIRPVHEEGHQAYFEDGPTAGTAVAVVGVPELYGAEFGIGK